MRVAELWRYPVKSLQGEPLRSVDVGASGIEGDRRFALQDRETGFGLTARRHPELLFASARLRADGSAAITLPDGTEARDDADLSGWLGRPVTLVAASRAGPRPRYETPADFEHEADGAWGSFEGATGAFHDEPGARLSLLSSQTIGPWDPRRFRANVLLEGGGEDALVGTRVALGELRLDVTMRIPRCVMTTRAQPGGIGRDLDVLRTIARERGACLAVGALVVTPGRLDVGVDVAPA